MEFTGITEIIGSKGTGKTTYIMNLLKGQRIAYFTTKKLSNNLLSNIFVNKNELSNLHINTVFDVYKLKYILINNFKTFIETNNIQSIVVDTFDSCFTTLHNTDKKEELFLILKIIKNVCFKYRINTFIIQEFPMKRDPFVSYVIKYDIKYMINKQCSISKKNEIFTIKMVDFVSGNKCQKKFKVYKNIIIYVDE